MMSDELSGVFTMKAKSTKPILSFFLYLAVAGMLSILTPVLSWGMEYQLYKNAENFGIVVFPPENQSEDLKSYFHTLNFKSVETGQAVMRFGPRKENQTYMMPLEIQEKHSIKMFIILQALVDEKLLVGIYHPDWELTLPTTTFLLQDIKEKIEKTLNVFRGSNPAKKIRGYEQLRSFFPIKNIQFILLQNQSGLNLKRI
jgi:hypothetical protein